MKILVLGSTGMLGHMVVRYLSEFFEVQELTSRWPSTEFTDKIKASKADYLVNCIGAIPQRTQEFEVNYKLPIFLDKNFKGKIIHPGTDCEVDNDEYGLSKKAARDYLVEKGIRTKILKTSIIGPELSTNASLLEWFLSSEGTVSGYSEAMWSGITTLEWAKICKTLIEYWETFPKENIVESTCLSKYDLLHLIKNTFNKSIDIKSNDTVKINKCLTGNLRVIPIQDQLKELKDYYYGNRY